ncbi:hypothetical protein OUZ56_011871 [Daphnia magna]|uniref:Uncharacterized protein n=1 Tax=Daphnia magna TaxID=35525 RepID=A0ABQ9Z1H0_9CRUS|nr:hypothetical protein OUZ56_011871 [Daphnia magna]
MANIQHAKKVNNGQDLRLLLLSTNKLPAGIPEKLLELPRSIADRDRLRSIDPFLLVVNDRSSTPKIEIEIEIENELINFDQRSQRHLGEEAMPPLSQSQVVCYSQEQFRVHEFHPFRLFIPLVNLLVSLIMAEAEAEAIPSSSKDVDVEVVHVESSQTPSSGNKNQARAKASPYVTYHRARLSDFNAAFAAGKSAANDKTSPCQSMDKHLVNLKESTTNKQVLTQTDLDTKIMRPLLPLFPPTEKRKNLGEAIVAAFPCLGINVDGKVFSCHFYNQTTGSGFIETRLKRLREVHREEPRRKRPTQDSSPIQKKPRVTKRPHVKKNADYIFNEAECQFKVEWLKSHPPGGDNDTVIIDYSKATFGYRQKEIKQTLTEPGLIMKEYPRFKDFQNGSLFQVEFQLLYPDAKNFEKVFKEKFLFKILALANKKNIDIPDCPDECLKAVFVLLKLTPSIVKLRKDNADLIQLSETRDPHLKQPFICCMGTMETPTNFWIVIDRDIILCVVKQYIYRLVGMHEESGEGY